MPDRAGPAPAPSAYAFSTSQNIGYADLMRLRSVFR